MTGSRHEHAPELLGPAALGLLTTVEQRQLDAHVRSCAACRAELAALTAVAARLGDLDVDEALGGAAPPRVDAIMAAVAVESARLRRGQRLHAVLAAAASVAVLAAGVVTAASLSRDSAPDIPLEAVAVSARSGVDASADLVAHTWGVEIKLVATGLPVGQPYRVLVRTSAGRMVDAGAFLGTGAKPLRCNLNASVLRPDATAFVVRDARGAQVLTAEL